MEELEQKIEYQFQDKMLLRCALTHSSYANENSKNEASNERLEFLGDSVLGIVTSEYLFRRYPQVPEGVLTKMRASLVCEDALFAYAKSIGLGEHLLLGKGELLSGGKQRPSIQADAFEALIAAIFLDAGTEQVTKFVLGFIQKNEEEQTQAFHDYKTTLQEVVQKNPGELLDYVLAKEEGPDHDKWFEVEVRLNSNVIGHGAGKSKKQAEQEAARQALELMGL